MHRFSRQARGDAARARALACLALLAWLAALPRPAGAQGTHPPPSPRAVIPAHEPLNPMVVSRSALLLLPLQAPRRTVELELGVEYGSAVERNISWPDSYLLDAELLRVRVQARRALGRRAFVQADAGITGVHAGFADRFFEGYHELIDFTMEERDARPRNAHADRLLLERLGVRRERRPQRVAPSDMRVTLGMTTGAHAQTAVTVVLPTAPASGPYARGTAAVGLLQAVRVPVGDRLVVEGTAAAGYTPRRGELRAVQRTVLYAAGASAHLRVHGAHALYGTLFHHRAPYRGTGFPELDAAELSADFGYLWTAPSGRTWRVGLTEDIQRRDPGIDLVLKVSVGH